MRVALSAAMAASVPFALARRAWRGPTHPTWPAAYELAMVAMRTAIRVDGRAACALLRDQVSPMPWSLAGRIELSRGRRSGVEVEIHRPRASVENGATLLYLHGGGFVTCSPASHRDVIARIAAGTGARCIVPRYRLAPEHPFPAALDDAAACYHALLEEGVTPSSLFVAGDSSGAGLCISLLLKLRDSGVPLPRAAVLLSPWVDLSAGSEMLRNGGTHDYLAPEMMIAAAAQYAGGTSLAHPLISPIFADLEGLPPMLIQTGGWELLCEQHRRFVCAARSAGVVIRHEIEPGMLHAFTCFAGILPQGRRALTSVARYVRAPARAIASDSRALPVRATPEGLDCGSQAGPHLSELRPGAYGVRRSSG